MAKSGGITSTVFGFFIGVILVVFGAPLLLWNAESQHRAADFETAQVVDELDIQDGYVVVDSEPAVNEDGEVECPGSDSSAKENCLYIKTTEEVYTAKEETQCGDLDDDAVIIQRQAEQCDENGQNCEQCYLVETYDWKAEDSSEQFIEFFVGLYSVIPSEKTNFIGKQDYLEYAVAEAEADPVPGDVRYDYTYFPVPDVILVAGDAEGGEIRAAYEDKPYVISDRSWQGTLEELQAQDTAAKWGLRIASLAAMVFGVILIFGPLMLLTNIFRVIPFVGKHVDEGIDGLLKFILGLVGFVLWLALWLVILTVKNILFIIVILLIVALIAGGVLMMNNKKGTQQ